MSSSRRCIRRAVRPLSAAVALLVVAGGLVGGCSSNSSSSPSAAASASAVTEAFHLSDDSRVCLEEQFGSNSTARQALGADGELSSSQRDAVAEVVDACVTVDDFAATLATSITNALPPADSAGTATQQACLTTEVLALDDARREALLVGLVVIGTAPQTGELALARGEVLNGLYEACSVVAGR